MKIRNEKRPKSTRYLAAKQTATEKKEKISYGTQFLLSRQVFFSEKGLLHWLLSLCNSPFVKPFCKSTQKLVSPKLTSSA